MTTGTPAPLSTGLALTRLSEDEQLFFDSVAEFAAGEVAPIVRDMDEHGKLDPRLIKNLFALGVMGVEVPVEVGSRGTVAG